MDKTTRALRQEQMDRFTNRDVERARLMELVTAPVGSPLPVVMFYGVGGAGKTLLLERFRNELDGSKVPWAKLDFDPQAGGGAFHTDSAEALIRLRTQFGDRVTCPTFDLAYAFTRFKQGQDTAPKFRGGDAAGFALEFLLELGDAALADVPGGNLVTFFAGKLGGPLKKRLAESTHAQAFMDRISGEDFQYLRRCTDQDIYPELAGRLIQDLNTGLPERPRCQCRGVLFLDSFESLRRNMSDTLQQREFEDWVRELARPKSRILLVIAGRDRLDWESADPAFAAPNRLEQHLIGGFSESDARIYLQKCGIKTQALRDAILRVCEESVSGESDGIPSFHAFSLGLCVDAVEEERARGEEPAPESFDLKPGNVDQLAVRFRKSLPTDAMQHYLRLLARTPVFDRDAACAALRGPDIHAQTAAWERLIRFSFVQPAQDAGWFRLHPIMRECLNAESVPGQLDEDAKADHEFFSAYWNDRSESAFDAPAALAFYHGFNLSPASACQAWEAQAKSARKELNMSRHLHLLTWWSPLNLLELKVPSREIASVLGNFANECLNASVGPRGQLVTRAIACYEAALRVHTEREFPQGWAGTQNNLGIAYRNLPAGDRGANLSRAIACYEAALRVYTEREFPQDWAMTQNNLGTAYGDLPAGDRGANLSRAIACYEAALRVYTEREFPQAWAATQNNLGAAYNQLPTGDRGENLSRAIACYKAALRVRTEREFPQDWAATQNNLGAAYSDLPTGDRGANLSRGIACFEAALRVRTEREFPQDWATTQNNLGTAYSDLPAGDRGENLSRGIACFEAALRVRTEREFPRAWATTQNNLGLAYSNLPTGDRGENLSRANECYGAALRVYTLEGFPYYHELVSQNLALANEELRRRQGP